MTEIIIDIEHGEKLKFRSPITSGKAYEILKLDPRAGSGTLSDKNDYLLPPGQALLQAADGPFVFRRQGAGVRCATTILSLPGLPALAFKLTDLTEPSPSSDIYKSLYDTVITGEACRRSRDAETCCCFFLCAAQASAAGGGDASGSNLLSDDAVSWLVDRLGGERTLCMDMDGESIQKKHVVFSQACF